MLNAALEEIPRFIAPMLASAGPAPIEVGWALEVKWDGMRAQVRYDGRRLCVRSRPGRDCTAEFPELAAIADSLGRRGVILDAELVCLNTEGKPDFAALRNRLGRRPGRRSRPVAPATLMIFDLLHLDGRAVRQLPYTARRELVASLELEGPAWRAPRHFLGQAEQLLAAAAEHGLEGVVAKRPDSVYREGRSRSWLKIKHRRRERLAVTGWRERDAALPEFLLARPDTGGRLRAAGSASLGLDADRRAQLLEAVAARELPHRGRRGRVRWVAAGVEVLVDAHGPPTGAVRDAILRGFEVTWAPRRVTVADIRADPQAQPAECVRDWIADGSLPALRVGRGRSGPLGRRRGDDEAGRPDDPGGAAARRADARAFWDGEYAPQARLQPLWRAHRPPFQY